MTTPPLSKATIAARVAAYTKAVSEGYRPTGTLSPRKTPAAAVIAAERLGIDPMTVMRAVTGDASKASPPVAPEADRAERYDSAYWRKRASDLDAQVHELERRVAEVTGLLSRNVSPPKWIAQDTGTAHRAAGLLTISDIHAGEVVRPDEIGGVNEYDPDICRRRIRRLIEATLTILPRWAADCQLSGVVVALNGDLVSGVIHDELRRTNGLTLLEQVYLVADEMSAAIEKLADSFGAVLVTGTPGNHGRETEKMHAKRVSALSFDILAVEMIRRHFSGDDRVSFLIATGADLEFPIFGWNVFQSHGDALGTGGGKGFAGPVLPIARGAKNVEWQAYRVHKRHDIILTAHYHTSSNPARGVLANGSVVGYNEFANRIRAGIEPPQQWLALVHERWGIRERCEIQLEDGIPNRPRVRVPAVLQAA
jgi:hypothetical protein